MSDAAGGRFRDGWLAIALLVAAAGHRVGSVATVERLVAAYARLLAQGRHASVDARAVGQQIDRLGTRLPGVACLEEAVVCHAVLEAHHVESELHLGVAKPSNEVLAAHAWVTADDRVIVGDEDGLADYARLPLEQWP